jgi:catechol 2,3-dioxygenase-like lactoylglutathione lyase family enzyme
VTVTFLFAGLPVADLDPALAWYERLLGRAPDMRPHAGEAVWQLTDSALVYVVTDPERAGHGLVTLIVDDLDAQLAELRARGLEPEAVEAVGAGRKALFADPEGNSVAFAQVS